MSEKPSKVFDEIPDWRQMPVAWRWRHKGRIDWQYGEDKPDGPSIHLFDVEPLYAGPR